MQKLISSVIESGHGSTIEHVVFTFAISGVSRTLSHQLVRHRAGVAFDQQSQRYVKFKGAATMLPHSIAEGDPDLRERYEEQVDGALGLYGELRPGRDTRRGRAVRLPERDPDQPRDDDEPAGAHPHVGPAAVHDGPVGDPAPLPADPPRGLRGLAVPRLVPGAEVRARSATATSSPTATSTARSGPTRTASWRPGRRRRQRPRRPAGSCRSPERARPAAAPRASPRPGGPRGNAG